MFVTVAGLASMSPTRVNHGADGDPRKVQHYLRRLRAQRGLTLKQISDSTGLSVSTLHAVEKQEREVTLSTSFKLAHFYGLSVADIWRPLFRQIGREMSEAAQ
jgi:transcriptional regulator with XRE-family HTH domain